MIIISYIIYNLVKCNSDNMWLFSWFYEQKIDIKKLTRMHFLFLDYCELLEFNEPLITWMENRTSFISQSYILSTPCQPNRIYCISILHTHQLLK